MKVLVPLAEKEISFSIISTVRPLLGPCLQADARIAGLLATLPSADVPAQPGPSAEVHLLTVLHPRHAGRAPVDATRSPPASQESSNLETAVAAEHPPLSPAARQLAERDAAAMLAGVAREHFPDATTACHVVWSETPAERIIELADEVDVDAIVMATHGRSAVAQLIVGSVAEGVIRKSRRPVVVQRPPMNHGQIVYATEGGNHV